MNDHPVWHLLRARWLYAHGFSWLWKKRWLSIESSSCMCGAESFARNRQEYRREFGPLTFDWYRSHGASPLFVASKHRGATNRSPKTRTNNVSPRKPYRTYIGYAESRIEDQSKV